MKQPEWIGSLVIALGIAFAGYFVGSSIVRFKTVDRAVEVRGLAERIVDSDQAVWELTYSASADDLGAVNARILQIQNEVIQFILAQGFTNEEMEKDSINITDKTTQEYGEAKGPRFIARGRISVSSSKVKEATAAAQKTDELLKKGIALASSRVSYYFTDLNSIKPAMLEEATLSARASAEGFAKDAGARVGGIQRATQGLFSISSPLADYDSNTTIKKKVRVVTQVVFSLE